MDRSQEGYGDAELRPAECGGEPHGCAAPDDEESLRREAEADGALDGILEAWAAQDEGAARSIGTRSSA